MERIAWEWADEIVGRYKGRLINWDVFNEITHGDYFVRHFGYDFFSRVIARVRELGQGLEFSFIV